MLHTELVSLNVLFLCAVLSNLADISLLSDLDLSCLDEVELL